MLPFLSFYVIQIFLLAVTKISVKPKSILLIAFFLSVLFSGLRFNTGNDYHVYYSYFEDINNLTGPIEPGFYLLSLLSQSAKIHPFFLFFGFSYLYLYCIYLSCKSFLNPNYSYLLFLFIPGLFLNSFHMPRQYIAVGLFIFSITYLLKYKSLLRYIFLAMIAAAFHYTSILAFLIGLLFYLYRFSIPQKSTLFFILISSYIVGKSGVIEYLLPIIFSVGSKYEIYAFWNDAESNFKLSIIFLMAAIIIIKSSHVNHNYIYKLYFKLWYFGVIFLFIFCNFSSITRIVYYFSFFFIPVFLYLCQFYSKKISFLFKILVLMIYVIATFQAIYNDYLIYGYNSEVSLWNYRSILENLNDE